MENNERAARLCRDLDRYRLLRAINPDEEVTRILTALISEAEKHLAVVARDNSGVHINSEHRGR